jgi:hypothetical protein
MFLKWPNLKSDAGASLVVTTLGVTTMAVAGVLTLTSAMNSNSMSRRGLQASQSFENFHSFIAASMMDENTCNNILGDTPFNPLAGDGTQFPTDMRHPGNGDVTGDIWYRRFSGAATAAPDTARPFGDGVIRDIYLTKDANLTLGGANCDPCAGSTTPCSVSDPLIGCNTVVRRSVSGSLIVSIENIAVSRGWSYGAAYFSKRFPLRITVERAATSSDATGPWIVQSCTSTGGSTGGSSTSQYYTGWSNQDECFFPPASAVNGGVQCPVGSYAAGSQVVGASGGAQTYIQCCPVKM